MIATVDKELFADIIYGLVAITVPLALYIAYLDIKDWYRNRRLLELSRALTRFGWGLTVSAVALRSVLDEPPIEHAAWWLTAMFVSGLVLSCAGFMGIARHYHDEAR